jgi:hypothetical protein
VQVSGQLRAPTDLLPGQRADGTFWAAPWANHSWRRCKNFDKTRTGIDTAETSPRPILLMYTGPRNWRMNKEMWFCRDWPRYRQQLKIYPTPWPVPNGFVRRSEFPSWRAGSLKWRHLHDVCITTSLPTAEELGLFNFWSEFNGTQFGCYISDSALIQTDRQTEMSNYLAKNPPN